MPGFNSLDYAIPSEDGSTLWRFDRNGKHLQTNNALTGAVITTFGYDAAGKLITVTDGDGNVTTIQRDGAWNATGIVSPYGVRTALTLNANGYLASVTDPGGNITRFTYSADGLMASMTDPNGGVYTFTHDAMGKLTADHNPVGGGWTLTSSKTKTTQTSSITSAEGRVDTTLRERLATGSERLTMTSPSGATSVTLSNLDASTVTTTADGTVTTVTKSPDSRYGMMSPTRNVTLKTPSGLTMTSNSTRAVTLSNAADPLSVSSITDTQTVNAKATRTTFNKTTMTFTTTTPMGKQVTKKIDAQGRIVQSQLAGINPVAYSYDVNGRMRAVTQGTRTSTMSYDASWNLSSVTDAMGRVLSYGYDASGRVTSQTLPDGRVVAMTYDANGNITSIAPPSRPAHGFAYAPVNLESSYNPPAVTGSGATVTTYAYNLDKQLTTATRPDGKAVSYSYDTAGRLSGVTSPDGNISYTYGASGCPSCGGGEMPQSVISVIGGVNQAINHTFDGALLTSATWSGSINGSVSWSYNNDMRLITQSVNGANIINLGYDNDGLLTNAGSLTLSRNTQSGAITGSMLGAISTAYTYDTYGDLAGSTASKSGAAIMNVTYTRDVASHITRKVETISGVATTYDYQYDTAGRLVGVLKNGEATSSYVYDNNSNRITATQNGVVTQGFYDLQDRLTSYGLNTYTYTANGELASKTSNGQVTSYNYDVMGNLVSVSMPDGRLIEYVIDGHDRRIGKKINGLLVQGLLYKDRLEPIAELDGAGNVVSTFRAYP